MASIGSIINDALAEVEIRNFNGVIVCESTPHASQVIELSKEPCKEKGGVFAHHLQSWIFPSGARLSIGALDREDSVSRFQGMNISWLGTWGKTDAFFERTKTLIPWLRSPDKALRVRHLCAWF